jgi:hypothetical protein
MSQIPLSVAGCSLLHKKNPPCHHSTIKIKKDERQDKVRGGE